MKVYLQGTFLLSIEFILLHKEPLGLESTAEKPPKKRAGGFFFTMRPIAIDGLWLGGVV